MLSGSSRCSLGAGRCSLGAGDALWKAEMLSRRRCFLGAHRKNILFCADLVRSPVITEKSPRHEIASDSRNRSLPPESLCLPDLGAGDALWGQEMLSGKQRAPLEAWMLSRSRDLIWEQEIASGSRSCSLGGRDAL